MATIKAGAYRFNDVLTVPDFEMFEYVNFSVTPSLDFDEDTMTVFLEDGTIPYIAFVWNDSSFGFYEDGGGTTMFYSANGWKIGDFFTSIGFNGGDAVNGYGRNIFIDGEQTVTDSFAEWFASNTASGTNIIYDGKVIASLVGGQTATLKCGGKKMKTDITVTAPEAVGEAIPSGTAIPVGKTVERIYFNIHQSTEETNAYLSQLTYVQTPLLTYPIYAIYAQTEDGNTGYFIFAVKLGDEYEMFLMTDVAASKYVCIYDSGASGYHNGWKKGYSFEFDDTYYDITVDSIGVDGISLADFNSIPVGTENGKIKNVLSSTPFVVRGEESSGEGSGGGVVLHDIENPTISLGKNITLNNINGNANVSLNEIADLTITKGE